MVISRGIGRTAERPRRAGAPSAHSSGATWSVAVLSRDPKPQESESEEDEQRLKDEVHLCVRKVMEAKDPMDPDDVEAQDEAGAREHAPKE